MKKLTEDQFFEIYKPLLNHFEGDDEHGIYHFETNGEELDFVKQHAKNKIWTCCEEDDALYIQSGFHTANRLNYYITELPWEEDIQVELENYND